MITILKNILGIILDLLLEITKLTIFILTFLITGYFIIINIVNSLFSEIASKNLIITMLSPDLNRILLVVLGVFGVEVFIAIKRKELKLISPFSLTKEEMIVLGLSSYFLAYFIKENLIATVFIKKIFLVILTLIFFVCLPQIVNYYLQFNLNYLNKLLKNIKNELSSIKVKPFNWRQFLLNSGKVIYKIFPYLLVLSTSLIIIFVIVVTISLQVNKYLAYQSSLRRKLYITKIQPTKTTIGEIVRLEGYNFGFNENIFFQVKTNQGLVTDIKDWNNNKVEFIVPLTFREGQTKLWLERTKETSTKSALLKSNQVDLEILSRWEFYPESKEFQYPPALFRWINVVRKKVKRFFLLRN